MEADRPATGEELNTSDVATAPRQAATVIVLRGGSELLEVLLVRRTPEARFMGGVWVFPGGAVDDHEGQGDAAHRLAAVRELREEAGIDVGDPGALVRFSRWITPAELRTRFDTHFFLAPLPEGQTAVIDRREIVDAAWLAPSAALAAQSRGELPMVLPTLKHLSQLAAFPSAEAVLDFAASREVVPVTPRVRVDGEVSRVVLPGEPGYED